MEVMFNATTAWFYLFLILIFLSTSRGTEHSKVFSFFWFAAMVANVVWLVMYAMQTAWFFFFALLLVGLVLGFSVMGIEIWAIGQLPRIRELRHDDESDFAIVPNEVRKAERYVSLVCLPLAVASGVAMFVFL